MSRSIINNTSSRMSENEPKAKSAERHSFKVAFEFTISLGILIVILLYMKT